MSSKIIFEKDIGLFNLKINEYSDEWNFKYVLEYRYDGVKLESYCFKKHEREVAFGNAIIILATVTNYRSYVIPKILETLKTL